MTKEESEFRKLLKVQNEKLDLIIRLLMKDPPEAQTKAIAKKRQTKKEKEWETAVFISKFVGESFLTYFDEP